MHRHRRITGAVSAMASSIALILACEQAPLYEFGENFGRVRKSDRLISSLSIEVF